MPVKRKSSLVGATLVKSFGCAALYELHNNTHAPMMVRGVMCQDGRRRVAYLNVARDTWRVTSKNVWRYGSITECDGDLYFTGTSRFHQCVTKPYLIREYLSQFAWTERVGKRFDDLIESVLQLRYSNVYVFERVVYRRNSQGVNLECEGILEWAERVLVMLLRDNVTVGEIMIELDFYV